MENENLQVVEENNALTLKDLFFIFKRNILMIGLVTFVVTLIGAVYGFCFKDYTYSSKTTIMVKSDSQSTSASNYNDTLQSLRIVNTIKEFIMDDLVLEATAKELTPLSENDPKYENNVKQIKSILKSSVTLNNSEESLIITISMKSTILHLENSEEIFVVDAINTLIANAKELSNLPLTDNDGNLVLDEKGNVQYKYQFIANNIQDLLPAKDYSASRGASIVVIICFIVGLVVGYLIALFRYLLDDTFKTKEDLEKTTGISVLAFIEDAKNAGGKE